MGKHKETFHVHSDLSPDHNVFILICLTLNNNCSSCWQVYHSKLHQLSECLSIFLEVLYVSKQGCHGQGKVR